MYVHTAHQILETTILYFQQAALHLHTLQASTKSSAQNCLVKEGVSSTKP